MSKTSKSKWRARSKAKGRNKKGKDHNQQVAKFTEARKIISLSDKLGQIYSIENLETVCCRQCTCCRVACPQMKYSEAVNIIDTIWSTWSKADKKNLLVKCVEYYFSDSLIKPCLLLAGDDCRIYKNRPLNCRLFGLWPSEMWNRRVEMFSKSTELPVEKLPLNTQCPNVKRKGDLPQLTEEQIMRVFKTLDSLDMTMGIKRTQVDVSWNYRTLHDWILLKFWGEDTLVKWTNIILATSWEEREAILDAFYKLVDEKLNDVV
jgi:Fe-S-cluster containining protein